MSKLIVEVRMPQGMQGDQFKEWKLRNDWKETKKEILARGLSCWVDGVYCRVIEAAPIVPKPERRKRYA